MTIEDRLTRSLHDGVARLETPPGDLDAVRRTGGRLRRRRRVLAGIAAGAGAVVVAGLAVVATWDRDADRAPDPAGTGGWQRLEDAPVPGRSAALSGWTGQEALFVGGDPDPCPAAASCVGVSTGARDGAAYDPGTDTWRVLAPAPEPLGYWYRTTMVGDTMVVSGEGRWWAYDAGDDAWTTLPAPPTPTEDTGSISSSGGLVYAMGRGGRVQVLDPAARAWSELPAAPTRLIGPVVATGDGVVVSGATRDDGSGVLAQVWDGTTWTEVPVPQGNPFRHWTGERLVELDLQRGADGEPAGGILDPATGRWTPLPEPPEGSPDLGWSVNAADGPLVAAWGLVYDDRDGSQVGLPPHPEGAPVEGAGAVWADGRLLVFGGTSPDGETVSQAWTWTR